ncbi:unnamed protein product [Lathyrus oleraceus]
MLLKSLEDPQHCNHHCQVLLGQRKWRTKPHQNFQQISAEEHLASQRLRQKLEEVNVAAQTRLAPVQDHVNYTLQKAYFKCAYECFDRSRRREEISHCVENCSIPITNVQQTFDNEMGKVGKL